MNQTLTNLLPMETLPERVRKLVPGCSHPESTICQKLASNDALMYFKVCMTCGATLPSGKGELSHRNVASRYRVEEITPKSFYDRVGEAYMANLHQQRSDMLERYTEYLSSPEWDALRQQVIERDGSCRLCDGPIQCVHHLTYERVFHETLEDLAGLCQGCHELIHAVAAS